MASNIAATREERDDHARRGQAPPVACPGEIAVASPASVKTRRS